MTNDRPNSRPVVQRTRDLLQSLRKEMRRASKIRQGIPDDAICFFKDGDKMVAVFGDFKNLQESPAGFGETFVEAFDGLIQSDVV